MNAVSTVLRHARLQFVELLRSPGALVPTVAFPAMFYALFAMPYARTARVADFVMLSMMAFAISGVCLYQFGVGIAAERGRPWERYLRSLPVSTLQRFAGRILCAVAVGLAAAGAVALVARAATPVDLTALQWIEAFGIAAIAAIPFVAIGITIGYWTSARAAVPIATACNLLLAYAGGLWMPPEELPHNVQALSVYLPTRAFGDLMWGVPTGSVETSRLAVLAIYAIVFLALAAAGYRRDERTRYA